jgi:hypothetical protein
MPAARDDYLLRLITQAAAAIRRFRERLRGSANADEIVRDAGAAIGELLGPQRSMLDLLDARSAASLLGKDDRVRYWIDLLRIQAEAHRAAGHDEQAVPLEAKAAALDRVMTDQPG